MGESEDRRASAPDISTRQQLLVTVERLPKPQPQEFKEAVIAAGLGTRLLPNRRRQGAKAADPLDRPWRTRAAFWARQFPEDEAAGEHHEDLSELRCTGFVADATSARRASTRDGSQRCRRLSFTICGTKMGASYYLDSRPDRQRAHAKRAESADPTVIADRAKQMIAEARRAGKMMTARDAMLQATDEITADFETLMRRRYGDIVVDIFGIPDAPH